MVLSAPSRKPVTKVQYDGIFTIPSDPTLRALHDGPRYIKCVSSMMSLVSWSMNFKMYALILHLRSR